MSGTKFTSGYFLCDQLDNARFLWKQIPAASRDADAGLCAIWARQGHVGQGLSCSSGCDACTRVVTAARIRAGGAILQREHMSRTFAEIAKAYSLIRAESGARALGVSVAKFSEMATLPDGPWMRRAAPTSSQGGGDREETADDGAAADVDGLRRTHREGGQVAEQMRWDQ